MIYFDKLFTANQKYWEKLGVPYVAQSAATNYVTLNGMGDFVVDYDVDPVVPIPTISSGGTFDPAAEVEKQEKEEKEKFVEKSLAAEEQSKRDGGVPRIEVVDTDAANTAAETHGTADSKAKQKPKPDNHDEKMGNDLESDPVIL